jgi:alpha-galactosidase
MLPQWLFPSACPAELRAKPRLARGPAGAANNAAAPCAKSLHSLSIGSVLARLFPLVKASLTAILKGATATSILGAIESRPTLDVTPENTVVAVRMTQPPDGEGFPLASAWAQAPPIRFAADWTANNADPQRETEVRVLWSPANLYVKFAAKYRLLTVFADSEPNGRRDQLWDRDVAEAFLQPAGSLPRHYKEFEVSPNGLWIDLDIAPGEKRDLLSVLRRRATVDEKEKLWHAELIIPMNSIAPDFDPTREWRANFYRVEGAAEPRFYSAWRPTMTPQPNFHVPEKFGRLIFAET